MFLLKVSGGKLTILLFAQILTELLGIAEKPALSLFLHRNIKHSVCQWMTSRFGHRQCLYCRQTLGWSYQFLEHRPWYQSQIPALLFSAPPWQAVFCSQNSLPTEAGRQWPQVPLGSVSHTPHRICSLHRLSTLLLPMQPAKAPFPSSPTHSATATTDDH